MTPCSMTLSLVLYLGRSTDLLVRAAKSVGHDLASAQSSIVLLYAEARRLVAVERRAFRIASVGLVVGFCLVCMLIACSVSNSLTLTAFTNLLIFDTLYLVTALTSLWAGTNSVKLSHYTLGYERFEVVAVFATTVLAILSSFFEIKEAVERFFEPVAVFPDSLLVASQIAFAVHLLTIYGIVNPAFNQVVLACGSSWLQEHATDISRIVCRVVPGLARILLPRVNPLSLIGFGSSFTVAVVYWMMSGRQSSLVDGSDIPDTLPDTVGGVVISLMLLGTMTPMMWYSGRILLQTIPTHLVGPLDKALREASTIDGVLELRNEHVWSVGFKTLAGSVYVRVRRDANEQMVLAYVTDSLSKLVHYLTVQVYKDDWTRSTRAYTLNWPLPSTYLQTGHPFAQAHITSQTPPNSSAQGHNHGHVERDLYAEQSPSMVVTVPITVSSATKQL